MPDQHTLDSQLARWVPRQKQRLVRELTHMVSHRSVAVPEKGPHPFGKGCAGALDEMLALSRQYGLRTQNHGYYCGSCWLPGSAGTTTIGIFGHLDVVPEGTGWQGDPYRARADGDYLIGRGASDNKGPSLAALYALRFLREHNILLRSDVRLVYGCAEEIGMQDMDYFAATQAMPDFSLVPDSAFPVCYGEKGHIQFRASTPVGGGNLVDFSAGEALNIVAASARGVLRDISLHQARQALQGVEGIAVEAAGSHVCVSARGLGKHSAFPEGSVDALGLLARTLAESGLVHGPARGALAALGTVSGDHYGAGLDIPFEDEDSGKLTHVFSLASMQGEDLMVGCDIRYPISAEGAQVRQRLERRLEQCGYTITQYRDSPPAYVPLEQNGVIAMLCGIANRELGTQLEPFTMGGGTYSRKLTNAVGFGPGRSDLAKPFPQGRGGAHQPDEAVHLPTLLDMIPIYVKALIEIDAHLAAGEAGTGAGHHPQSPTAPPHIGG